VLLSFDTPLLTNLLFLELVIFNTLPWDRSGIVQIPRKGNEGLIGQAKSDAEVGYVAGTYYMAE
jgi:hypothetical protein